MRHAGMVLAIALAAGGCGERTPSAEEAAFSNRLDSGEVWREEQARVGGNRILPPFEGGGTTAPATAEATAAAEAPAEAAAPAATAALPLGEYGCIGSGTTQLAGMGSKLLAGGRYTDLDGGSPGTWRIVGDTIVFTGGHLDGEVGRDIRNNGYTIGRMVSCQKW